MEHFGFWSLLPPVLAILLAIGTRQVFIALGIWYLAWLGDLEWRKPDWWNSGHYSGTG